MIQNALVAISDKMKAVFKASGDIPHNLTKGESRERAVINTYLKNYLPPKYGLTSGIVIDSFGNFSKQQDIIIYDRENTMPLFSDGKDDEVQTRVPIENVFAIIEVKSILDSSAISDAFDKFESVCSLVPVPQKLNPVISISTGFPAPVGFCFAFNSDWSIERIAKEIQSIRKQKNNSKHISAFCVLGKGVVQYGTISNIVEIDVDPSSSGTSEVFMEEENEGDSIVRLTWLINNALNQIVLGKPDLTTYLEHSLNPFNKSICVSPDIACDGMQMIIDGKAIKVFELSKLMRKFGNTQKIGALNMFEFLTDNSLATKIIISSYFYHKMTEFTSERKGTESLDFSLVESLVDANYNILDDSFLFSDEDLLNLRIDYFYKTMTVKLSEDNMEKLIASLRSNKDILLSLAKMARNSSSDEVIASRK